MSRYGKPTALISAQALEMAAADPMWANHCEIHKDTAKKAAAALRAMLLWDREQMEMLREARRKIAALELRLADWEKETGAAGGGNGRKLDGNGLNAGFHRGGEACPR
ncbi:MAG: hypothetical protein LBV56_07180 [Delftia acidovorans]|jgi:hypothetical protein|nr:hypothetical protein [Delftia acidovorans]